MTETLKIKFPDTDLVGCKFVYKTSNTRPGVPECEYDEFGRMLDMQARRAKQYVYRVPKPLQGVLKSGDMVVVFCQTGYQVCEVCEINATSSVPEKDLAWVIDRICIDGFKEESARVKQLEAMKVQITKEKKRLEAMVTFELIAERNPEFAAMLKAFVDMGGEV